MLHKYEAIVDVQSRNESVSENRKIVVLRTSTLTFNQECSCSIILREFCERTDLYVILDMQTLWFLAENTVYH